MRKRRWTVVVGGLGLVLAVMPVRADHAFSAEFDAAKPINIKGTVTKMEWTNPHSWIHIDHLI